MPNVDGWQVLRGLARDPATARIPVVICSVLKEPELAFSLGARAYLKKPVDRSGTAGCPGAPAVVGRPRSGSASISA